jgi:hypothetical protein
MHLFSEPWLAVASVLVAIREGLGTADKLEHKRLTWPSEAELIATEGLKDEMPAILFDDFPI